MSKTALLVIDIQKVLVKTAYQPEQLLANNALLLKQAREKGIPVFYMQHESANLKPGTEAWEIPSEIAPQDSERVIGKIASDSFYQTPFKDELQKAGITQLVITGMRTERCVDTTSRTAISHGFDVILVADAHSTSNRGGITAAQIIKFTNVNLNGFGNDKHRIIVKKTDKITF